LNGWYDIITTDLVNNWWQTGYANVHFTYVPENNQPYTGEDIYILGEFTGNKIGNENKMEYNADKGIYEKTLLLKQGYYAYTYVTKDGRDKNAKTSTEKRMEIIGKLRILILYSFITVHFLVGTMS